MKRFVSLTGIAVAPCLLAAILLPAGMASAQEAEAQMPDYEQVKATIWAIEKGTFDRRAQGSTDAQAGTHSPYFKMTPLGWAKTPQLHAPLKGDKEQIALTFVNLAYNGQTAVSMYKSHRTRLSDGTPSNEYFEITHVWSKEGGQWRLLASRSQPVQPPGQ